MDALEKTLVAVWREVSRHLEIGEAATNIALVAGRQLPLSALHVYRLMAEESHLEVVATGVACAAPAPPPLATEFTAAEWKFLTTWCESGALLTVDEIRAHKRLACILRSNLETDILVGPLVCQAGRLGLLTLCIRPEASVDAEQRRLAESLLEPFSAALENDLRMRELSALREAAEADRRKLLSRLGQKAINDSIVGAESGLRHVMERAHLVAHSDVPVLILGETGTGKEVVARNIHMRSRRASGPFIRVNCGAIPSELIDSQLFGHERGSFTGATDQHQGWFERADGGTLFLDEIGELPLAAQVRLLRVLQDHQIERVGGKQPIHLDVRIVAATHRDLAQMVKARTFREDLWYRINVFPILLPRLRERVNDIPALVRHFSLKAANRFGLSLVEASPADLQLLMAYPWPGNIRELGAVIDRAVILGNGRTLEVAQALGLSQPVEVSSGPVEEGPTLFEVIPETTAPIVRRPFPSAANALTTIDEAMRQHIEQALTATAGRIEGKRGAAAILGINPHTLRARMRKLQIDWGRFRRD